jgi:hypothetical protein
MGAANAQTARSIDAIKPYDGPTKLAATLEQAFALWGGDAATETYVFTDRALPANQWHDRAHAWVAPSAGDNVAVTALDVRRKPREIEVRAQVANYGRSPRKLLVGVSCDGDVRNTFTLTLDAGQSASHALSIADVGTRELEVRIQDANDALASDDAARAILPPKETANVAVLWPEQASTATADATKKKNEFVDAVLKALQADGAISTISEDANNAAATVYVNRMPESWPKGGAIVLYPLRAGVLPIAGMQREVMSVTHQSDDPLLADVDLRGVTVKDAIRVDVPNWAWPLVWSNETPLVWAGQTGETKVLFVGIPIVPSGSRLPLVASFPVLVRNALRWMLPQPEIVRAGESIADWSPTRAGFVADAAGNKHAVSVLSAETSDLRRPADIAAASMGFSPRHSLATVLVILAMALLAVEWGLFHKRLTE